MNWKYYLDPLSMKWLRSKVDILTRSQWLCRSLAACSGPSCCPGEYQLSVKHWTVCDWVLPLMVLSPSVTRQWPTCHDLSDSLSIPRDTQLLIKLQLQFRHHYDHTVSQSSNWNSHFFVADVGGHGWQLTMSSFKPKLYRSQDGCCICKAKSSR